MTTTSIDSMNSLPADADVREAVRQVALAAFMEGRGIGDFLDLNCDGLIAFRERHGLEPAVMNLAWDALQTHECARRDRETDAFLGLFRVAS